MIARLIEQGDGLEGLDYGTVVYADDGELYRLTSAPGCIHTDDRRGNYRRAQVERYGRDVSRLTDDEYAALPQVRVVMEEPS
jgi:hypothetical protein